uniref:Apoptotic protease-activating factor 1 n=1 Tax=Hydra vulgaris TaxID=6087 RepID=T2MIQ6_HYDVU
MNENQRHILISNRKNISQDLMVEDVLSYLQSKFAINIDDVDVIKLQLTSREKVEKLISILLLKQSNYFGVFYSALKYAEYDHLAELLVNGLTSVIDHHDGGDEELASYDVILKNGGVPSLPQVFVKRNDCIQKVNNALCNLKSEGWVVLHGMAGCGKTVLAISALNNERMIHSCFPGGVFWINLGQINETRLLMKMQNLCLLLDLVHSNQRVPQNLEEARDRLRILFSHQHPRSLLVIDDLWSSSHAKYFNIHVRTLVTTRYSAVADQLLEDIYKVPVMEQLHLGQSRQILSQWVNISIPDLPKEADLIIEECKGSPLALSMIGALLKIHKNRWNYYLTQLREQKTSKVRSKVAYEYPSLYDAIAVSFNDLEEVIKKHYESMVVFEENSLIPSKTLEIYWELDEVETEDIMHELIEHSLATKTMLNGDNFYSLHGLNSGFLKERAKDLHLYHSTIVNKYESFFQNDFLLIKEDKYICWYFVYHLIHAGNYRKAVELLQDFSWLTFNILKVGPAHLIQDYYFVLKEAQSEEDKKNLTDMVRFFSVQSDILSVFQLEIDLIQLALCRPTSEFVYNLAKTSAQKIINSSDRIFYEWINHPQDITDTVLLTSKLHGDAVNYCSLSHNTTLAVSCSRDGMVKVWDYLTGAEKISFSGHDNDVKWCEFSFDDENIISCSTDKTIKVWNMRSSEEEICLRGHTDEVLCCRYSKNKKWIASTSMDKSLKIWEGISGKLYISFNDHTDVVNCCSFSNCSNLVVSCSNDCTTRVWNIKEKNMTLVCSSGDFCTSCIFSLDDQFIFTSCQRFVLKCSSKDGDLLEKIETASDILSMALSYNGKHMGLSHQNMCASVMDLSKSEVFNNYYGHSSWVNSINFSRDGSRIITASADGACKVWSVKDNMDVEEKLIPVFDVSFESGFYIVVGTNQKRIKLFSKEVLLHSSLPFLSEASVCKFANKYIAIGFQNGDIKILNWEDLSEKFDFRLHSLKVSCMSSSNDKLVVGSEDHCCSVWNLENGCLVTQFKGHENFVTKCAFLNESARVVSSSFDGKLKIWCSQTGSVFSTLHEDKDAVMSFFVSEEKNLLCLCSANGSFKVWSISDCVLKLTINDHKDVIRCIECSNDGTMIASGSDDGSVKIWNISTGKLCCECTPHDSWVTDLKFCNHNDLIMTVSNNLKLFNVKGVKLQTLNVKGNFLQYFKATPDLCCCVTIDNLGFLYIMQRLEKS